MVNILQKYGSISAFLWSLLHFNIERCHLVDRSQQHAQSNMYHHIYRLSYIGWSLMGKYGLQKIEDLIEWIKVTRVNEAPQHTCVLLLCNAWRNYLQCSVFLKYQRYRIKLCFHVEWVKGALRLSNAKKVIYGWEKHRVRRNKRAE